ncbi:MAG: SURF1 family protein [Gemmatimonadetes bacterium]|nr:SURF1 family protein [Gemmatimonadota bacterium]
MRAGEGEAGRSTQPRRPRAFTGRGIAAALLVIGITAVCIRLGIWQLDRHAARERLAASLESAAALPPLELTGDSLREVFASAEEYLYRRVRLTGSYEPGSELVLRGRALGGAPGIHIVTPLQLLGESAVVLVNRGWAPSPDAATIDPLQFAEPGSRTLEGILQPIGSGGDARETRLPVNGRGVRTVQRIDFSAMSAEISPSSRSWCSSSRPYSTRRDRLPACRYPWSIEALTSDTLSNGSASPRSRFWASC